MGVKILQGGIRLSLPVNTSSTEIAKYAAGKAAKSTSTGIAVCSAGSGSVPVGLLFDAASEVGSSATITGGGGGSTTTVPSTGGSQSSVTVIGGQFYAELSSGTYSGLTSSNIGLPLSVNVSVLVCPVASGCYIVGQMESITTAGDIKILWNSVGVKYVP